MTGTQMAAIIVAVFLLGIWTGWALHGLYANVAADRAEARADAARDEPRRKGDVR